jgi:methylglutaconyl-CoA hydratase
LSLPLNYSTQEETMNEEPPILEKDGRGVARLTLNRPDVHNAFDDELIARFTDLLQSLENDDSVRALVL